METKNNKEILGNTLAGLAEIVLKNNILEFDLKTFKQKPENAIGTKFIPLYAILFRADIEDRNLEIFKKNLIIWWRI